LQKCLLPLIRFLFRVEDNYQHSVHCGFTPFNFWMLSAVMHLNSVQGERHWVSI
jgi:hypothetical protein